MRIHYLQHVPFEGPAMLTQWAQERNHNVTGTQLYNYEDLPHMEQFDWLIIMGGPMNIYQEEEYPWLKQEKKFIRESIRNHKIVIGICLGAQLITDVLGGKVTKNPQREIGWFPVTFNSYALQLSFFKDFAKNQQVFHWHGDTFHELGEGCKSIASSAGCEQQAFIYEDKVIGFQFHMESSENSILSLIENCGDEMTDGIYVQNEQQIIKKSKRYLEGTNTLIFSFLNRLEEYHLEQEACNGKDKIHSENL